MAICWFCHWGWPKPVAGIFKKAVVDLNGNEMPMFYAPSHSVWADENFDAAQWCLDHFDDYKDVASDMYDYSQKELEIVRRSLQELANLPRDLWDVMPKDYDGEHPEKYPPKCEMEWV